MKHYYTRDGLRASSSKNLSQITTSDNYEKSLLVLRWLLFNDAHNNKMQRTGADIVFFRPSLLPAADLERSMEPQAEI
jgi:hypothetical protein